MQFKHSEEIIEKIDSLDIPFKNLIIKQNFANKSDFSNYIVFNDYEQEINYIILYKTCIKLVSINEFMKNELKIMHKNFKLKLFPNLMDLEYDGTEFINENTFMAFLPTNPDFKYIMLLIKRNRECYSSKICKLTTKIKDLKTETQIAFFKNKLICDENKTLDEIKMIYGDEIEIYDIFGPWNLNYYNNDFVFVEDYDGLFPVRVKVDTKVIDIKNELKKNIYLTFRKFIILVLQNGILLEDDKYLFMDYEITKNSIIYVEDSYSDESYIKLFCKFLTGKTTTIIVHPDSSCDYTKKRVSIVEGIPLDQIRIVGGGRQLNGNKSIKEYNIKKGDNIHCVLRLCGGKPVIYFYNFQPTSLIVKLNLNLEIWEPTHLYPTPSSFNRNIITWNCELIKNKEEDLNYLKMNTNKKFYSYIFWEALTLNDDANSFFINNLRKYYVFDSEVICDRLDDILHHKGLNTREREDFITYWMPDLVSKKYCMISFMDQCTYDSIANLKIEPCPEKILRVFMVFKPTDSLEEYETDNLIEEERFIRENMNESLVVEWGAMNLDNIFNSNI